MAFVTSLRPSSFSWVNECVSDSTYINVVVLYCTIQNRLYDINMNKYGIWYIETQSYLYKCSMCYTLWACFTAMKQDVYRGKWLCYDEMVLCDAAERGNS
jgi:hypothetical protein